MATEVQIIATLEAKDTVKGLMEIEDQSIESAKGVQQLEDQYKDLVKQIDKVDPGTEQWKQLSDQLQKVDKDLQTATADLEEVAEATELSEDAVGGVTDAYKELQESVASSMLGGDFTKFTDEIINTNEELDKTGEALEPLTSEDAQKDIGRLAEGISGVAASAVLIGDENSTLGKFFGGIKTGADAVRGAKKDLDSFVKAKTLVTEAAAKATLLQKADTTATVANTGATVGQTVATEGATVAQFSLNAAMLANPVVLIIAAVAALAAGIFFLGTALTEASEEQKLNNELTNEAIDNNIEELSALESLSTTLESNTGDREAQNQAIKDFQKDHPELLKGLSAEAGLNNNVTIAINSATKALIAKGKAEAAATRVSDKYAEILKEQAAIQDETNNGFVNWVAALTIGIESQELANLGSQATIITRQKEIDTLNELIRVEERRAAIAEAVANAGDPTAQADLLANELRLEALDEFTRRTELENERLNDRLIAINTQRALAAESQEFDSFQERLTFLKQFDDAVLIETSNHNDIINQIESDQADKQLELDKKSHKDRLEEQRKFNQDRLDASRQIEDLEIRLLDSDLKRSLEANRVKFERLIEDVRVNKDLELEERIRLEELFDLRLIQSEREIEAKAVKRAEDRATREKDRRDKEANQEVQDAFDTEQRIDEAKIAAREARGDVVGEFEEDRLLSLEDARFEEDLENLRFQLEQGQIVEAEFNALEEQATAEHEAAKTAIEKEALEKRLANEKAIQAAKVGLAQDAFQLVSDIASLFAGQSEAAAKRAFEIDKAAKIASAVLATITGAQNAFASASASPITIGFPAYPFLQAASAAAFGAVNIAKIAQTQFEGGGGGGSVSSSAPSIPETGATTAQPTTSFGDTGGADTQEPGSNQTGGTVATQPIIIQNNILESDITDTQANVAQIEQAAEFD